MLLFYHQLDALNVLIECFLLLFLKNLLLCLFGLTFVLDFLDRHLSLFGRFVHELAVLPYVVPVVCFASFLLKVNKVSLVVVEKGIFINNGFLVCLLLQLLLCRLQGLMLKLFLLFLGELAKLLVQLVLLLLFGLFLFLVKIWKLLTPVGNLFRRKLLRFYVIVVIQLCDFVFSCEKVLGQFQSRNFCFVLSVATCERKAIISNFKVLLMLSA